MNIALACTWNPHEESPTAHQQLAQAYDQQPERWMRRVNIAQEIIRQGLAAVA